MNDNSFSFCTALNISADERAYVETGQRIKPVLGSLVNPLVVNKAVNKLASFLRLTRLKA
ncbi:hypothetical protein LAY57_35965 [Argonema antarcticum A004/B2]|nr:hypothetical protein [Argonema antarcticum A004/B2]